MVGLELPIVPIEHHYLITEPVPEVAAFPGELPVLRDTQSSFYIRAEHDGLLVGPFEPSTVATVEGSKGPTSRPSCSARM